MRIIPKKIKVKNTVWKCYSMPDILVALVVFAIVFVAITAGNWGLAIFMGFVAVIMFMPTSDGILYSMIFENIKFLITKKKYTKDAPKEKERIENEVIKPNDKRVALFAHQGFGIAFLSCMLDIPYPAFSTHFDLSHSSMTVIEFKEIDGYAIPQILTLSSDSHLYKEGIPTFYNKRLYF